MGEYCAINAVKVMYRGDDGDDDDIELLMLPWHDSHVHLN